MDKKRKEQLEKDGWKFGTVAEFLNLTPEESELVEIRFALVTYFKLKRNTLELSQINLASKLGSSQSRISKLENGDASNTLGLYIESLVCMGATRKEIAAVIAGDAA